MKNEETCEWSGPIEICDNEEFEIQCRHNPLRRGVVPNNFATNDFVYCPFCGRKIKRARKAIRGVEE